MPPRLSETGDETTQRTWYTSNGTTGVVAPLVQRAYTGTQVLADGQEASMVRYTYDGRAVNGATHWEVVSGTLTAQSVYTQATSNWLYANYVTTRFGYDAWGNQTAVTDTLGRRSTTGYDSIYHTYPTAFTNALTQTSYLGYDFGLGKPLTATLETAQGQANANNVSTYVQYDSLGPVVQVIEDGDSATYPTIQYVYSDTYHTSDLTGLRVETTRREVAGSSAAADVQKQYEFYTGRGILVQSRAETGSQASPQRLTPLPLAPSPLSCCREATPPRGQCFFLAAGEGRGGWG